MGSQLPLHTDELVGNVLRMVAKSIDSRNPSYQEQFDSYIDVCYHIATQSYYILDTCTVRPYGPCRRGVYFYTRLV